MPAFTGDNIDTSHDLQSHGLEYRRKGLPVQNFGDFLNAFFVQNLFYGVGLECRTVHVVGSVLSDSVVQASCGAAGETGKVVFWGCGLRDEASLSPGMQHKAAILAVRGPLTRSALRLGISVPVGDPALLLPALHSPAPIPAVAGKSLLIPHVDDMRCDAQLLEISGCDLVLRPNLPNDLSAITDFIDHLTSARFVLTGALHGAVTAAAYGIPFAYWDSGDIDLPFKWHDFSASLAIPCSFHRRLNEAQAHYKEAIKEQIQFPRLLPLVASAPFPVRTSALARIASIEIERHGPQSLLLPTDLPHEATLAGRTWRDQAAYRRVVKDNDALKQQLSVIQSTLDEQLNDAQARHAEQLEAMREENEKQLTACSLQMAEMAGRSDALALEAGEWREHAAALQTQKDALSSEIGILNAQIAEALFACDTFLARVNAIESSRTWRVVRRLQLILERYPSVRKLAVRGVLPVLRRSRRIWLRLRRFPKRQNV